VEVDRSAMGEERTDDRLQGDLLAIEFVRTSVKPFVTSER